MEKTNAIRLTFQEQAALSMAINMEIRQAELDTIGKSDNYASLLRAIRTKLYNAIAEDKEEA